MVSSSQVTPLPFTAYGRARWSFAGPPAPVLRGARRAAPKRRGRGETRAGEAEAVDGARDAAEDAVPTNGRRVNRDALEPRTPARRRFGPCLCAPPLSMVWHCEHLVLKIFAPLADMMAG